MMWTLLAMAAAGAIATAPVAAIAAVRPPPVRTVTAPSRLTRRLRSVSAAARAPESSRRQHRLRVLAWTSCGLAVWVVSGWPAAGLALTVVGLWAPWLLGSARVAREQTERLEALEAWCRRMADMLTGGGTVGLAQAVTTSVPHVDERIARAVTVLARRLREGEPGVAVAMREFADVLDDRLGDTVAAALLLALHQQSTGVGRVLRQLADGVARDVRERRRIEAERAESRQSIRMLLIIQAAVLVMLALVPNFTAAYGTGEGQVVMAVLLAGTLGLLVWMRRLGVGRPAPRFLGGQVGR